MQCIVVRNGGYEAGALRWCQRYLGAEKFFFMQDSARIKEPAWLDRIMCDDRSYCVNDETGPYSMYTGAIRMEVLRKLSIPETSTKVDAVMYEMSFGNSYAQYDPDITVLWPELRLENARDDAVFGRPVKVYENEYFLKYKGCWGGWMVSDCCSRDQTFREQHEICAVDDTKVKLPFVPATPS